VLGAGVVAEGTVVDAAGAPIAGVEVRSTQAQRCPAALTGADGRYRLPGVARGEGLQFRHPLGERTSYLDGDSWSPTFPRTVRLNPWEVVPRATGARRDARLRVVDAAGAPLPNVELLVVGVDDGSCVPAVTDDDPPDLATDDDEDFRGKEVRLVLRAGETRRREVTFVRR
jgi:hypothetical protein